MKKITLLGSIIITILVLILSFFSLTTSGLQLIARLLQPLLTAQGIHLKPNQLDGTLADFQLKQLKLHVHNLNAQLTEIHLTWQPWQLLRGHWQIAQLHAAKLQLNPPKTPTNAQLTTSHTAFSLPEFNITQLHIAAINWKNHALGTLKIQHISTGSTGIKIKRFLLKQAHHQIDIQAHIPLTPKGILNVQVSAQLQLSQNRQLNAHLLINGTWQYYQGKISFAALKAQQPILRFSTQFTVNRQQIASRYWHSTLAGSSQMPITGHFKSDWSHAISWDFELNSQPLNLGALWPELSQLIRIHLNSHKTAQFLNADLHFAYGKQYLTAALNGRWQQNDWQLQLTQLQLQSVLGHWQQPQPADIRFVPKDNTWHWQNLCLAHQKAHVCTHGHWSAQHVKVALTSNRIPFSTLPTLIYGTQQTGTAHCALYYQRQHSTHTGKLNCSLQHLAIQPTKKFGAYQSLEIPAANLQIQSHAQNLTGNLKISLPKACYLQAHVAMAYATQKTQANLRVHIQNIGLLNLLFPALYQLHGQLTGHWHLSGEPHRWQNHGELTLIHAGVTLPLYGLAFKDSTLALHGNDDQGLRLIGHTTSGTGQLNLNAQANWQQDHFNVHATLNGQNATLLKTPALHIIASPQLSFTRTSQKQALTGKITIPTATINADLLHQRLQLSPDIIWTNAVGEPIEKRPILPFYSQLQIALGQHVSVQGFGIYAHLAGNLNIKSTPDTETYANGTLKLKQARYENYGKVFEISKGLIQFNQRPIDNPTLNVVAHYQLSPGVDNTRLDPIQIGVRVLGTFKKPQVTLFSQPSMSQADILSYIVVGAPLSGVQGDEKNALSRAALSYSLNGGADHSVLSTIQSKLGIDQINVGSINSTSSLPANENNPNSSVMSQQTGEDNTAIFIGKAISPRLYISYGIGLFNQQQEIRTRYQLSRYFQLLTDHSSEYSGIDLVFTFNH